MRLDYLGHASWLVESREPGTKTGLRILTDPLLFEQHAGGVFEVVPKRRVEIASLRPDFVFVSHVHFDHFDVDSLHALAKSDPQTVLVTSDELVERSARMLGFETIHRIGPGTRVELAGGLTFTTTPSYAPDIEWGIVFADPSGVVWNMIDTVFPATHNVRSIRADAIGERRLDLALAPIQIMREIALATADHLGFIAQDHAHALACAAATGATVIAPSACGEAFTAPFRSQNHFVYPISRTRATSDVSRFAPGTRTLIPELGQALHVDDGHVELVPGSLGFERLGDGLDPRAFRPLEPAPIVDPNFDGLDPSAMTKTITRWCETELAPALGRTLGAREDLEHVVMVLEVVLPDADRISYRFDTKGSCRRAEDREYDVLVLTVASMLVDVIEGRRAWVEPLLAGLLRSSIRGVSISPGACKPLSIAAMFPYYCIGYRESVERSVLWRAEQALRG